MTRSAFLRARVLSALLLLPAAGACGDDIGVAPDPVPDAVTVLVSPDVQRVEQGDTLHLAAAATRGTDTVPSSFTWRSTDPLVASVDARGIVRGVAAGSARIVATAATGDTASAGVTVTKLVARIALSFAPADSVPVGWWTSYRVTAFDADGGEVTGLPVRFSSSDSLVANGDGNEVGAYGWGEATVTIGAGRVDTTIALHVRIPQIGAPGEWADVDVGDNFACALRAGTSMPYCWGSNFNRRLGYALTESRTPLPVDNARPLRTLAVGYSHSCGLAADSTAWCWGTNGYNQLGAPTPTGGYGMVQVDSGRRKWLDIDAGGHGATCGIGLDTLAYCWGHNDARQLARGPVSAAERDIGVAWEGRRTLRASPDQFHSCMLDLTGAAYCSGREGTGLGAASDSVVGPRAVLGGHVFRVIETGWYATCGLLFSGEAMCWGYGQVGSIVASQYARVPTPVAGGLRFTSISVGLDHSCGLTADGVAWCWEGEWGGGPIGVGGTRPALEPVRMLGPQRWRKLVVAGDVTCGITTDDRLLCMGDPRVTGW